jgi:outer membrane protein TolC
VDDNDRYVSMVDVQRIRTFRGLFQEQAVGLQVSRERAVAGLKLAMGLAQTELLDIADRQLPTDRCDTNLEMLKQQAFSQRPELRKVGFATTVADLEQRVAKAEFFPNVAAFASHNTINDDANFPNPNDTAEWAVGVTATVPIFSSGRRVAQVRQAAHTRSQVLEQRRLLLQIVEQEVQDAYLEAEEMAQRTEEAATAVESASRTQELFGAKLRLELVGPKEMPQLYEDLLTTRLLLATAQTRYLQGLFGYNVALAKLKLAIGVHPLAPLQCGAGDELPDVVDHLPVDSASGERGADVGGGGPGEFSPQGVIQTSEPWPGADDFLGR